MPKRKRNMPDPAPVGDPLSNYRPPVYEDDLEQSLCDDKATVIQSAPFRAVPPEMTIADALSLMSEYGIACLVVTQNDKPVGILSERDVLNKIVDQYEQAKGRPIRDFMTANPMVVREMDPPARVLNLMGTGSLRHVPVVDTDGKLVGIIGARRVTAYVQQYFSNA